MVAYAVGGAVDVSGSVLSNITRFDFTAGGPADSVIIGAGQFDGIQIITNCRFTGTGVITVNGGTVNASLWNFKGYTFLPGSIFLTGGTSGDLITGTAFSDTISGGGGADTLTGGEGDDVISGNEEIDVLNGGGGNDQLFGNKGNDQFWYSAASDLAGSSEIVDGGAGTNDKIFSSAGGNRINYYNATITNVEALQFASGDRAVFSAALPTGLNLVIGGDNADWLEIIRCKNVDLSGLVLQSWSSDDRVRLLGTSGNDTITGTVVRDEINASLGTDILSGGLGDDAFIVEASNLQAGDEFRGGGGTADEIRLGNGGNFNFTTAVISGIEKLEQGSGSNVTSVTLTAAQAASLTTIEAGTSTFLFYVSGSAIDVSGVVFSGWTSNDVISLSGNGPDDEIIGSNRNDVISLVNMNSSATAGEGDDRISMSAALAGNGRYDGGAGSDMLDFSAILSPAATVEAFAIGLIGIETIKLSNQQSDTQLMQSQLTDVTGFEGRGSGAAGLASLTIFIDSPSSSGDFSTWGFRNWNGHDVVRLEANAAANVITGTSVSDVFDFIDGADVLSGGNGNDSFKLSSQASGDIIAIDGGDGTDTLDLSLVSLPAGVSFQAQQMDITGIDLLNMPLGADTQTFLPAGLLEQLSGIVGRGAGGAGVSRLYFDVSSIDLAGLGSTLNWNPNDILVLTGSVAGDVIGGSDAKDEIHGGDGNDTLRGANSGDLLDGGIGGDTLHGGDSADRFYYDQKEDSIAGARDIIEDFSQTDGDIIDVHFVDAITGTIGSDFTFVGLGGFTGLGQIRYSVNSVGDTVISFNVEGDAAADFLITLKGSYTLTAADFAL